MDIFAILIIWLFFVQYSPHANGLQITNTEIRDLQSLTSDFGAEADLWQVTFSQTAQIFSFCNDTPMLGGFNVLQTTAKLVREYTSLPAHNSIYITLTFWLIDKWKSSDNIGVTIFDGLWNAVFSQTIMKTTYNEATWTGEVCGDPLYSDLIPVKIFIQARHSNPHLYIEIRINNGPTLSDSTIGFAGLRDVQILLSQRTLSGSKFCGVTQPAGLLWSNNNCKCSSGEYWNTANSQCESCHASCEKCLGALDGDCYECKIGYWFDGTNCASCDPTCSECFGSGPNKCEACHIGATLDANSQCIPIECEAGYWLDGANCSPCDPTCSECSGNGPNKCEACPPGSTLDSNSRCIPDPPPCLSTAIQDKFLYSNGSCLNSCPFPLSVNQQNNIKHCKYPCQTPSMYFYPKENKCEVICQSPYAISKIGIYSICSYQTPMETAIELKCATEGAVKAGLVMTSAVSKGSQIGVTVAVMAKMFQYIKYLNISYSQDLEIALANWNSDFLSLDYGPGLPEGMKDTDMYEPLPYMFALFDVQPSFIANYWDDLSLLELVLVMFIFFKSLEWTASKYDKLKPLLPSIQSVRLSVQTFLLVLVYNSLGDIVFYSVLEYRSLKFHADLSKLSFSFSIGFMLIDIAILSFHIRLLLKYQNARKEGNTAKIDELDKKNKTSQALFKDYKDQSFGQQAFLLFFIARDIMFSLILTTLFEHPLVQAILINLMNVCMILYLACKRPLRDTIDEIQQLSNEVALLVVNISVLIMAALDVAEGDFSTSRDRLGTVVIMVNVVFNFVALLFMGLKLLMAARDFYKAWKAYNKKKSLRRVHEIGVNSSQSKTNILQHCDTSINLGLKAMQTENTIDMKRSFKDKEESSHISDLSHNTNQILHISPHLKDLSKTLELDQSGIIDFPISSSTPGYIAEQKQDLNKLKQEMISEEKLIKKFSPLNYMENYPNKRELFEGSYHLPGWGKFSGLENAFNQDGMKYISPFFRKLPRGGVKVLDSDLPSYELNQIDSTICATPSEELPKGIPDKPVAGIIQPKDRLEQNPYTQSLMRQKGKMILKTKEHKNELNFEALSFFSNENK